MSDEEYEDCSVGRGTISSAHHKINYMAANIAESILSQFDGKERSHINEIIDTYLTDHAKRIGYDRKYVHNTGYTWFPIQTELTYDKHSDNRYWPKPNFNDPQGLATAFAEEYFSTYKDFVQLLYKKNEGIALIIVLAVLIQRASKEPTHWVPHRLTRRWKCYRLHFNSRCRPRDMVHIHLRGIVVAAAKVQHAPVVLQAVLMKNSPNLPRGLEKKELKPTNSIAQFAIDTRTNSAVSVI